MLSYNPISSYRNTQGNLLLISLALLLGLSFMTVQLLELLEDSDQATTIEVLSARAQVLSYTAADYALIQLYKQNKPYSTRLNCTALPSRVQNQMNKMKLKTLQNCQVDSLHCVTLNEAHRIQVSTSCAIGFCGISEANCLQGSAKLEVMARRE